MQHQNEKKPLNWKNRSGKEKEGKDIKTLKKKDVQ